MHLQEKKTLSITHMMIFDQKERLDNPCVLRGIHSEPPPPPPAAAAVPTATNPL